MAKPDNETVSETVSKAVEEVNARRLLYDPFPSKFVEWKVQATSQDKSKAMLVAYVDPRHYMKRLDEVDPEWSDDILIMADGKMVVKLTVLGVSRCSTGESEKGGGNEGTSAEAQAFKRACVKHGLGRYLYYLPRQWVGYDGKNFNADEVKPLPKWALPKEEQGG